MDSSPDSFGSDLVSSWGADTLTISDGEALPCLARCCPGGRTTRFPNRQGGEGMTVIERYTSMHTTQSAVARGLISLYFYLHIPCCLLFMLRSCRIIYVLIKSS